MTQLYLPESLTQELYRTPDYVRNAEQDTFNNTDLVIGNTEEAINSLWIVVQKAPNVFPGRATLAITPGSVNDLIIVPPGRIPPLGGRPHDKPVR